MGGRLPWLAPPRWLAPLLVARCVDAASLVWDGMERDDPTFDAQTSALVYGDTSEGYLNVSKVGDAVSGAASLRVDYEVVQAEGWGGFAQYSRVFAGAMLDCSGATELSFWYNNVAAQSAATRAHLRLIVHECEGEDGCLVENAAGAWASSDDVENHYAFFGVLDDAPGWRRAAVAVDELVFTGWSGTANGDQAFDPGAIVEYTFQFSVDAEGAILSSTAGAILLDRLACDGPDDLVFAPLAASPAEYYGWVADAGTNLSTSTNGLRLAGTGAVAATLTLPAPAFYEGLNASYLSVGARGSNATAHVTTRLDGADLATRTVAVGDGRNETVALAATGATFDGLGLAATGAGAFAATFAAVAADGGAAAGGASNSTDCMEVTAAYWYDIPQTHSYQASTCCDICAAEEGCNYYQTDEVHCYRTRPGPSRCSGSTRSSARRRARPSPDPSASRSSPTRRSSRTACKSTGLGRPDQTLKFSSSVKSKSIRLIFGRIDCSHGFLEEQRMCLCQNIRIRAR